MEGSQDTLVSGNTSAPTMPQSVAPITAPATDERVFKQSEVNDIVKKAKYGAVEDYRRQATQRPEYVEQKYSEAAHTQPISTQPIQYGMPEQQVRQLAAEEAQRLRNEWTQEQKSQTDAAAAQQTVQQFWNKISPGKDKYQDFDSVTGDIEYARFPNVVELLARYVDNSHDVLYELGKDRIKMANLEQLAYMSPKDAIVQAQRMAKSIADNASAQNIKVPNEPLSQLRATNTGTDNGVLSVKDYRARYKV